MIATPIRKNVGNADINPTDLIELTVTLIHLNNSAHERLA